MMVRRLLSRIRSLCMVFALSAMTVPAAGSAQRPGGAPSASPWFPTEVVFAPLIAASREVQFRGSFVFANRSTVEDFQGTTTILAFKDNWQKYKEVLQQDAVVLISGKVSGRERDEEDPPIFLDEAVVLEGLANSGKLALQIELPVEAGLNADVFARAKEVLAAHPGTAPVELALGGDNGTPAPLLRSRTLKVDPSRETLGELQEMFGKARVRLVKVGNGGVQANGH